MSHPMQVLWYINPNDGPFPWKPEGARPAHFDQVVELAKTIDQLGYFGALTVGRNPFVETATLIPVTKQMRFLIPIYPGSYSPAILAQQAQVFDELSGGRLLFNQVNGTDKILPQYGIRVGSDERYELSAEYWTLFKQLYSGEVGAHEGRHFQIGDPPPVPLVSTKGEGPLVQNPHTPVWGSGASPAGIRHAGQVLDTYLTYLHRPDRLGAQIAAAREVATTHGRTLKVGTLANIIVRETEAEAWEHAEWVMEQTGAAHIVSQIERRLNLGRYNVAFGARDTKGFDSLESDDSLIQSRIDALRAGKLPPVRSLESAPNIWSGVNAWGALDLFDQGWGGYFVGSAKNVAERMRELQRDLGIDVFILAGWPLVEEAKRVKELLFPLLDLDHYSPALAPLRRFNRSAAPANVGSTGSTEANNPLHLQTSEEKHVTHS
ncbi:LLM class flavin-dependent oxidoreductase [Caballeronia sp. LjRoot34]|uniref:LLM class flavin-dependent oxidoreductase n=1 Tax=unclassified Caballeronia TaxID=2646786 RepID=UPI003ECD9473